MKAITVRLDDEVHRQVKMRAAQDGLAMESLGRVWFEAYGLGGTVVASTETTVRPRGLAAGAPAGVGANDGSPPDAKASGSSVVAAGELAPAAKPHREWVTDAKPCKRAHLHHTNHGGQPCPVCGWPDTADWKKGK